MSIEIKPISILIPYSLTSEGVNLWVQIRQSDDELNGLMEFPGGKIEATENPEEAAVRETKEETGVSVKLENVLRFASYSFTPLMIFVHLYEDKDGLFGKDGYRLLDDLLEAKDHIPPNNIRILEDIKKRFQGVTI